MRETSKKRAILSALASPGPAGFLEVGTPPYSAADVARALARERAANSGLTPGEQVTMVEQIALAELSGVARTLRAMAAQGLVVPVRRKRETWNAIAQRHQGRMTTCYWVAESMAEDMAEAAAWEAGREARAEQAFRRLTGKVQADDSNVIDA